MRDEGVAIGSVSICSFRPFPLAALREALEHAKRVVVLEKCLAVGLGGIVSDGVRKSLSGIMLKGYTVIAGLGGRAITRASLRQLFEDAARDELEQVTFLDLNADIVATSSSARRSSAAPAPPPRRSCAGSAPSHPASADPAPPCAHPAEPERPTPLPEPNASSEHDRRMTTPTEPPIARRNGSPSSSTRPARSPSATGCCRKTSARCRPTCAARTRSTPGTARARAAARRSARATRSTRRCARPATS